MSAATVEIRAVGSFLPLDDGGCIVNDCRVENVPAALRDALVAHFRDAHGDALRAVYVRGSVARGSSVAGVSDLDAFAVLADGTPPSCDLVPAVTLDRLRAAAPHLVDFELSACTREEVLRNYFSTWAFLVKTQAVCIHGEDLAALLKPYRVGPHLMAEAMYLRLRIAAYRERVAGETQAPQVVTTCQWMMKAIVRAAFDLTLDRSGRYTRDLHPCWTTFSAWYPERATDCERALRWAIAPDTDTAAHVTLVNGFGDWICTEAERLVALHGIDLSRYEL